MPARALLSLILSGALPLWGPLSAAEKAVKTRPNIVLFYADDLGYTDLSCQGSDYYRTPHIDRLAREGMTFTNAYAAAANCAPSRASLMTGLYTPRHGVFTVGNSDRGKAAHRRLIPIENRTVLPPALPTMAEVLKKAGYRTAVAGKWHLNDDPTASGFDANFGGLKWGHPKSYFSPYRNPKLKDGPNGEHLPARLASDLCSWIRSTQKQKGANAPFFVYFPFYSVHTPIQARADLTSKYRGKSGTHHDNPKYAAMIEAMDLAVGQLLDLLDELLLADNTLVVFTSDNGPHGAVSNARPLRGSKGMFYEGGIREPFLVRWPGRVPPGSHNETAIHQVDLLPTFASASGAKARNCRMARISLLSFVENPFPSAHSSGTSRLISKATARILARHFKTSGPPPAVSCVVAPGNSSSISRTARSNSTTSPETPLKRTTSRRQKPGTGTRCSAS